MTCYWYLPYTLTLKSPAIISALGGDPNSSSTLPFIPGAAMRGVVARALGDPGVDNSRQQEFFSLVLGGKVRYLNAYPCVDDKRGLPVPVSFRRKKDEPEYNESLKIVDLAWFEGNPTPDKNPDECWPKEQLEPLGQRFLTIGAQPVLFHPKLSARIHHQRDREKGRAWKDKRGNTHGAIFAYESLDAGQSFQGMIQITAATEEELNQTEDRIKALLGDTILVGRSRRAGYGGMASINWESPRSREVGGAGREGLQPVTGDIAQGKQFRLLLTSACIVRNTNTGQIDPAALEDSIVAKFDKRATLIRKRWSFEKLGGFNRKWRLELPQVLAVSAGSVFVFEAKQNISLNDLLLIENEGLGERKEEGYGRLLFLEESISLTEINQAVRVMASNGPPQLVLDIEKNIEKRIVWAHVQRKIEEEAVKLAHSANNLPSNSLIGRLRIPLRGKPEEAISVLKRWLRDGNDAERLKRPAMEQLERCRMDGGMNLHQWTIMAATESEKVLQWLNADVLAQRCHVVSEESAKRILEDRSQEISVQLIDAVLAAMAVRNKTKEAGNE